jgi:hypothetical protein
MLQPYTVTKHKTDYQKTSCPKNYDLVHFLFIKTYDTMHGVQIIKYPKIMFAAFYVCSLVYAVCSEIQDENTLQVAICHNVREHKHFLRKYTTSKVFKFSDHNICTCAKVMTTFYSYMLWEGQRGLVMQPQSRLRKLAGCVKVKQRFHYKVRRGIHYILCYSYRANCYS